MFGCVGQKSLNIPVMYSVKGYSVKDVIHIVKSFTKTVG